MGGNTMRIIGKLKAALEKISPAGRKNAGRIKAARNWLGCELGNKPDVLVLYLKSNLRKQYGLSEAETRELIMECLIKHERNAEAMMERLNPLMSKAKYVEAAEKSYMAVPGLMDIRDLSEVLNNIYSAAIRNSEFEQLDSVHRIIEKAGIRIEPNTVSAVNSLYKGLVTKKNPNEKDYKKMNAVKNAMGRHGIMLHEDTKAGISRELNG